MTVFIRSYRPAIRSNIARTCVSSRVPGGSGCTVGPTLRSAPRAELLQLGEEVDQILELLRVLLSTGP